MSSRAERRRNERSKDKLTESWIYFKPIDLVNKKITIQLSKYGGDETLRYLRHAMMDIMDTYGITTINIETNVKEENAGKLTPEEQESCRLGNSLVWRPPELEAKLPDRRYR